MPKWPRRWSAKPVLAGSSPAATSKRKRDRTTSRPGPPSSRTRGSTTLFNNLPQRNQGRFFTVPHLQSSSAFHDGLDRHPTILPPHRFTPSSHMVLARRTTVPFSHTAYPVTLRHAPKRSKA